jgi:hypothetical protein
MTDAADLRSPEADGAPAAGSEQQAWTRDLEKSQRTQLKRVQASARVWLGVLTTLLGLLGSVVLFKGGDLVTGVTSSGAFQAILIVLVGMVFGVAVLALIYGGQATWGGLSILPQPLGAESAEADSRPWWLHAWFGFASLMALRFLLSHGGERQQHKEPDWEVYRRRTIRSAHRRLTYLHASRTAGVAAAALIAMLAIFAVIAGTVSPPAAPPAYVIVVHHGRLTCMEVGAGLGYTNVTNVIPVSSC